MINIDGLSLVDKARVVAHEIIKRSNDPIISKLAKQLGSPYAAKDYLVNHLKYNPAEVGDTLSEPMEIIRSGIYDCEDDTLFIGAIAKNLGYKVEIRIVSNGTNHIYPLIYDDKQHQWVAVDPVPKPPSYILRKYHTVVQGEVTDNLNDPIVGVAGFSYNPIGLPDNSWKVAIEHPNFTRQALISDIAKSTRLSNLSGMTEQAVEVSSDYVPQPGDTLKFYYNTIKELPISVDMWIRKQFLSHKNDNFDIIRVYDENKTPQNESLLKSIEEFFTSPVVNPDHYIVVEVKIKKSSSLGSFTLAVIAISAVLVAGIGYLTLAKVEKILQKNPELSTSLSMLPYIGLGTVALLLLEKLKR